MLFFTYTLAYPDGRVFYVGKGSGDRISDHEREARRGINSHKCNTIRKIWREGGEVVKRKVYETTIEVDALQYEWVLINMVYGIDNLVNKVEGGVGFSGPTEDIRKKLSEQRKGKHIWSEEDKKRIGSMFKGKKQPKWVVDARTKNGRGKLWEGFIAHDGTEYLNIPNLAQFCRDHNLQTSCMWNVSNGNKNNHKGWKRLEKQMQESV